MVESTRREPFPSGLVLWLAVACVAFLAADETPGDPGMRPEELAAMQRQTDFVVRDVQQWQAQEGDRWIPWDEAEGHLAIVIDDVGRELHVLEKLLSLRHPLTFAVLPGSVYTAGAQLRLTADRRRFREIFVHLPMEPLEAEMMSRGDEAREVFLTRADSAVVLRDKVEDALDRIPLATGVNNHMGSALTADVDAMRTVMQTLREHDLVFLDSRTTAQTVAEDMAHERGLIAGSRSVFLDNEVEHAAIIERLREAAAASLERPTVAIGHPSVVLYEVLENHLPRLLDQGIGIYPASWILAASELEDASLPGPDPRAGTPRAVGDETETALKAP